MISNKFWRCYASSFNSFASIRVQRSYVLVPPVTPVIIKWLYNRWFSHFKVAIRKRVQCDSLTWRLYNGVGVSLRRVDYKGLGINRYLGVGRCLHKKISDHLRYGQPINRFLLTCIDTLAQIHRNKWHTLLLWIAIIGCLCCNIDYFADSKGD